MDYEKLAEAIELCGSSPKIDQCRECPYWNGGDKRECISKIKKDAAKAIKELKDLIEEYKNIADTYHEEIIPKYKRLLYIARNHLVEE